MNSMLIQLLLAISCATGSGSPEAQVGRAFEIPDYYATAFVGAPTVSPDGEFVAFAVRRYDFDGAESWSEIWFLVRKLRTFP